MKKYSYILGGFLILLSFMGFSFGYEQYGFGEYKEKAGNISFSCSNQCYIILGQKNNVDYLNIQGSLNGNGDMAYGFTVGEEIAIINQQSVFLQTQVDESINLSDYAQYFSSIPGDENLILLFNGNINGELNVDSNVYSLGEKFSQGWKQASQYYEYNPRTINFLEGPMRNGKYINQYFFKFIIILVIIGILRYIVAHKKKKRNAFIYIICVLSFFWVFFSFFYTKNQFKIYKDAIDTTNIMENGRVGKDSDFYQFLDFIKTKVTNGEKGYFIAPYPFDFEGKYHIYPDVKFDNITGVSYIFYYNPYGSDANTMFGFKDPEYSEGILSRDGNKINIKDVIDRKDYAKIYIVK